VTAFMAAETWQNVVETLGALVFMAFVVWITDRD